jgi:23S rRNA (adenine(2503)-C(2))-methyltransferase
MNNKEIKNYLNEKKMPDYRWRQIKTAVYKDGCLKFGQISNLPKALSVDLDEKFSILPFRILSLSKSNNEASFKAVLELKDKNIIETALISPKDKIWTACVSSQAGCPMGCAFCATGDNGFKRNLNSEEISGQVLFWKGFLRGNYEEFLAGEKAALSNVVYMGMGEPFLNWPEVRISLIALMDEEGLGFGARSISVSTIGIPEGMKKLANEFPQVNLAISLHSADNEIRSSLVPANKAYDLTRIKKAVENYLIKTNRKVFIEYIMISEVNDSVKNAEQLAEYLKSFEKYYLLHVNLIAYNDIGCGFVPSPRKQLQIFKGVLSKKGIKTTIRKSLGEDIAAACGQLAGKKLE